MIIIIILRFICSIVKRVSINNICVVITFVTAIFIYMCSVVLI